MKPGIQLEYGHGKIHLIDETSFMKNREYFSLMTLVKSVLFALAYFIAGLIGLEMQSAQTGISPLWPASGVALAGFIIYGIKLWPGIYLGMGLIAYTLGIPIWVALLSATGSILEAAIPLYIVQKYGFTASLETLRQLIQFLLIVCLGPLISASIGSLSFGLSGMEIHIPLQNMFFTWWLGNSFGMLLFGSGILLLFNHYRQQRFHLPRPTLTVAITIVAAVISYYAFQDMSGLKSALILNLMIPLVFLSSIFIGYAGALIPVAIACLTLVTLSSGFPEEATRQYPLGIVFLNIVELWIITLTGLLVSVAYKERILHMKNNWLSTHDGLTTLKNRHFVEARLDAMCTGLRNSDKSFCLLFLDLNDFKQVNDRAGHIAGDAGLAHVAKILQECTRSSDIAARWGGDEFILLLPDCPIETAIEIANNINQKLARNPLSFEQHLFKLEFSIGVARAEPDDSPSTLIMRADKASYQSKRSENNISLAEII